MSTTAWLVAATLCGTAGCSILFDSEAQQCKVDSDCNDLIPDSHPVCDTGVCVDKHLGPKDCKIEPLTKDSIQTDFFNACSTSKYERFSNCDRLGLYCSDTKNMPPPTATPPMTMSGSLPGTVTAPTDLCSLGMPTDHMIYMYGAADFAPMLLAAQKSLSKAVPPFRAVFQNASSCNGVGAIFDSTTFKPMFDPKTSDPKGNWAFYYDVSDPTMPRVVPCQLTGDATATTTGTPKIPDIGVSDLYAPTCNPSSIPGSGKGAIADFVGPIVQFGFSVPATSPEKAISVEAVHMIFGRGGKALPGVVGMMDASPWTDPNNYAIRNAGAASTVLTALLADVPRTQFWGVDRLSTDNLRDTLLTATAISSSIGILSIDYNDKNRDNLRALYLKSKDQLVGYLPDSSPVDYDKINVRDGHYPLWGYVHFFTPLSLIDGNPSPAAAAIVLKFRVEKIDQTLVDDIIAASLVPQCAMKVARTDEMGSFKLRDGFSCGCYFESKTNGPGLANCKSCNTPADCTDSARPACNYGFCEAR